MLGADPPRRGPRPPADPPRRVLVVTDNAEASPTLRAEVRHRAAAGDTRFRLVVVNPARAEVHLWHPERHDKAWEAEMVLLSTLPMLEEDAGGPVIGSVSVRHDPMDAIEETMLDEPVDEVLLDVPTHRLASLLHQDLEHRLNNFDVAVVTVRHDRRD